MHSFWRHISQRNRSSGCPVYCSGEQMRFQMEMYRDVWDHFSTLRGPQGSSTCTLRLVIDYGRAFIILTSLFRMRKSREQDVYHAFRHKGLQIWLESARINGKETQQSSFVSVGPKGVMSPMKCPFILGQKYLQICLFFFSFLVYLTPVPTKLFFSLLPRVNYPRFMYCH